MATGNVYTTLHGVILPPPPGFLIDHKNSNGLDNRRCNLRIATSQGNAANARKTPGFSSHFKGVRWHKSKMWTAQIKVNYQQKYLGSFVTEEEAARVYDAAAFAEWGDMARLNFPIDTAAVAAGNDWAGVPDEF